MTKSTYAIFLSFALLATGIAPSLGDDPNWPLLGTIKPRSAAEITSSTWSIGCETLDRDYAVYANYRQYLGPLGAKSVRLQAGWAKCEKAPGQYDWKWLDEIVDDAVSQGVKPWIETSYGNPIYADGGDARLGGGFPKSPEALAAWDQWVRSLVRRYRDRVDEWEVWNEPDHKRPEEYANLFIRTAEIIRAEQPKARMYGLALAGKFPFAEVFLAQLQERGKLNLLDAVTIHFYPQNPDDTSSVDAIRALLQKYGSSATVRQGETGAPSATGGFGALRGHAWSETTQAKWDLRRMLAHRGKDVPFNLFTLMELRYPTGLNSKGLLKANEDMTVARPKPAYFAAQRVFAVFDDTVERVADFTATANATPALAAFGYRKTGGEGAIVTVWPGGAPPVDAMTTTPVDLTLHGLKFTEPVYVDLFSGKVLAIPADRWSTEGDAVVFTHVPLYDSPILIADRAALPIDAKGKP
jgi:hypothetical protein